MGSVPITVAAILTGFLLLLLTGAARMVFWAPALVGWAMYLANVIWEIFPKKLGLNRFVLEALAAGMALVLLKAGGTPWAIVGILAGLLAGLEIVNRSWEKRLIARASSPALIWMLDAPFIERRPRYRLGILWAGFPFRLELTALNPAAEPQSVRLRLEAPAAWLSGHSANELPHTLPPGGIAKWQWTLCPPTPCGPGDIRIIIGCGAHRQTLALRHDGCRPAAETPIRSAKITRYPGARRSAFAWRGDMDLYDRLTFQSIEGLQTTLELAARYAFPQTMCLSTRLTLDEAAARDWAAHDGRDHGADEIPRFIEWLRANVEFRHAAPWPARGAKPFLMELGNHGHLHYDTAAAAAPENQWKSHARMGAGHYPWVGPDTSSFGEQRDNILEAARWCQNVLGITPRSWAKPGRCNDADTPRAAAAAGCEVLSGSDIRARDNVLRQPPPHHPGGTAAVELTSRYPPDPQHIYHLAMLRFWLHRSWRRGIPMIFMCHQHMRQWEGIACARFTEYLLQEVLTGFHGDFHVDTLFGVGKYWREVLSPRTARLTVSVNGSRLVVENHSDMDWEKIPVDVELAGEGRATVLVSVRSGGRTTVNLTGEVGK